MFFEVANINTPSLMTRSGLERVRLRLVWFPQFRLDGIEPTIFRHDASTGSWRYGNTEVFEGGIHSPFSKQRVLLLLFVNEVARRLVHAGLAGIHMRFVGEPLYSFLDPPFQNRINRGA